jgi:2-oxoglutarate dehydrogenase E1 component
MVNPANLEYIEDLYSRFLEDPSAVSDNWRAYFSELDQNGAASPEASALGDGGASGLEHPLGAPAAQATPALHDQINSMIETFRNHGHKAARLNPLQPGDIAGERLTLSQFGFTAAHAGLLVPGQGTHFGGPLTLSELHRRLLETYCGSIGLESMHIDDAAMKSWLSLRMEAAAEFQLTREQRLDILIQLTDAAVFEEFIQKKFRGAKSFSLQGAESLLPLLHFALANAAEHDMLEVVLAMAHRGRLNVLANVIGKPKWQIFQEFDDLQEDGPAEGDVKYHLGHSSDYETRGKRKIHVSLCFNPSHLEFVNPVALGRMRAKQDRTGDAQRRRGMTLMIHGDASFAGEGVVQETLNLSRLGAYNAGGTVHVIINNQIGFTTDPEEGRSTPYATDIAKMLQSPIFHVNGDDPEAVVRTAWLAMDFRRAFGCDVFIDMICYRRLGHNEGDEPAFTQPRLCELIEQHESVKAIYLRLLRGLNEINDQEAERMLAERLQSLERQLGVARRKDSIARPQAFSGLWSNYCGGLESDRQEPPTAVSAERLSELLEAQTRLPKKFSPHPKIVRGLEGRREMAAGKRPLDWAGAEALAFASLAAEGVRIRLSGQDSARGTFSHRHSVLHDRNNGTTYAPLQHVSPGQAPVEIYNSPLSEAAALGFEYGYSLDYPDALVLWEAQFGDFTNAAQVIIDQFITSAEHKWHRLSGIVLLLPHGFEGSGPEHSSARVERFLQLCVKDNIQVVYPTTAAQYFHCLRRQALRKWRKPLVVMTPKSLLRSPRAVSTLQELSQGAFQRILPDTRADSHETDRIILCSGKIYYDLEQRREKSRRDHVAILRLEQLYPLSDAELRRRLEPYPASAPVFWVQEEPENMGAWPYLSLRFGAMLFGTHDFTVISREPAASPATGSPRLHKQQQLRIVSEALETWRPGPSERAEELALC